MSTLDNPVTTSIDPPPSEASNERHCYETRISFLITRSLKNANTVRIPTLILVIYEHTCKNIATCYPLSAANVAKDSSGSSSMLDILTQANVQDPTIKRSYCLAIFVV